MDIIYHTARFQSNILALLVIFPKEFREKINIPNLKALIWADWIRSEHGWAWWWPMLPNWKSNTFTNIHYLGPFNIYVNKLRWVGGQSNVYYYKVNSLFLLTVLFTMGRLVVKKGQNSVYINIEWPLSECNIW